MLLRNLISLLLLLLTPCFWGNAQAYYFDIQEINVKDGLPHRIVLDIAQDKEGFIWIATMGAISRYDGKHFKTYDASYLGISEGSNITMAIDKDNQIWFAEKVDVGKIGNGGVLNHQKDTVYTLENYTNNLLLTEDVISFDKSSFKETEFFITTKKGTIYKYGTNLELIFNFPNKINIRASCIEASNGDYWIAQHGTVFQVRNQQILQALPTGENFYQIKQFLPNPIFQTYDKENSSWTYHELKNGQFLPYTLPNAEIDQANSIIHFGEKFNFFTTNNFQNLAIQDKQGNLYLDYKRPFSDGHLNKFVYQNVFVDNQNILWVALNNGLFKITQKKNPFSSSFKNSSIRGIYFEGDKQWIGGYKGSLFPNAKLTEGDLDMTSKIIITQFTKDEKGHLWIGSTSAYLTHYLPKENEQRLYSFKERLHLYCPFYNSTKNQLWIGTNHGLVHFDRLSKKLEPIPLSISSRNLEARQIYENKEGIWVVSSKGLLLIAPNTAEVLQYYSTTNLLPHNNLNYLHEDKSGVFWLASKGGGLIKWNRTSNTIQQFRQEDGLSNNVIYTIYEDSFNNLWLPSNYGLMAFDKITTDTKVYLPQNGIAHEEFNTYSHFRDTDSTLYFGGLSGITKFHPKDLKVNKQNNIPLYVTKVSVLTQEENNFQEQTHAYKQHNRIELDVDYQILEIELSLLDFESTTDNQYAYQIEGYQDQWIYTNDNKISFFHIPYGNYTINFKARGASGIWSTNPIQIPILVKTPFYLQSWFFLMLTILAIALILGLIKWREIRFEKDRVRLEKEVRKRTLEIEKGKEVIIEQAEKLKQLDKIKSRFFSNITHEFRTPLTLIIGPIQQIMKTTKEVMTKRKLSGALRNGQNILKLINQLLDISKLEGGQMQVEVSRGNLLTYTQKLVEGFKPLAEEKTQQLFFFYRQNEWEVHFDKDKWDKIIYNLLFNAIKFTPNEGIIQISLSKIQRQATDWISLRVSDTGIGIAKHQIGHIFNRFYQTDDSSTRHQDGTGIGLALVKELVELQGGEIWVHSKVDKGTTFEIQLPILNGKELKTTILQTNIDASFFPMHQENSMLQEAESALNSKEEKIQLLLIEDNTEMLEYIHSCIDLEKYKVITATNGQEGIDRAKEAIPDLVISDVMMPIKNGFEVTQAIRTNIATSHIPIILLTAKTALESKLEGLKRGAEAYLTKPFSPEELNLRIQKLIEIRRVLQKRYKNEAAIDLSVEKTEIQEREDIFITKLRKYILENLDNPSLNGEIIGKNFAISRMQLHRKIKALTNQSTSQFIQNIRFAVALDLLKQQQLNVSEIAYQTGFSNPRQFSVAFKRKFGKAPSNVMK